MALRQPNATVSVFNKDGSKVSDAVVVLKSHAPGTATIQSAFNSDVYAPAGIVEVK